MTTTLWQLFESMDNKPKDDEDVIALMEKGLELYPDRSEGKTFWDDFLAVLTSNSEAAAKLLGIRREVIATWRKKIHNALDKASEHNDNSRKTNRILATDTV